MESATENIPPKSERTGKGEKVRLMGNRLNVRAHRIGGNINGKANPT